ncbi:DUF2642 domain-containing protein [Domibacillus robiginosus]|uniref:DUF2642 domain-containing protein n=1 Tax=Domibacillus robiginosus TaxID=1071054 RepID=UPI00067BE052|nr:DUF2642 domain-containing protein [Domibacillus robiginosus]
MVQEYRNHTKKTLLPPGQYLYSPQFPSIMQHLSPVYTVQAEPVFLDHLLMHSGKTIQVVTTGGLLTGKLTGVAIDHLQLTIDNVHHHIRYPHIISFNKSSSA